MKKKIYGCALAARILQFWQDFLQVSYKQTLKKSTDTRIVKSTLNMFVILLNVKMERLEVHPKSTECLIFFASGKR